MAIIDENKDSKSTRSGSGEHQSQASTFVVSQESLCNSGNAGSPNNEKNEENIADDSECHSVEENEDEKPENFEDPEPNQVEVVYTKYPDDCFPDKYTKCIPGFKQLLETKCFGKYWDLRCKAYFVVEHNYFETFIIICILLSSMALVSFFLHL